MFKSTSECMARPDSEVKSAAQKANIEYITLDTKEGKLKVCKELSMHQQPLFTKKGLNPVVQETLKKQEADCISLCKV
jgi:hypothetical protein